MSVQSTIPKRWVRFKEVIITTLVGWIPNLFLGAVLRKGLYRLIVAHVGRSVYIQNGVELLGTNHILLDDQVYLFQGVRLNAQGDNNRLQLRQGVALERGVDIGAMDHTSIEIGDRTYVGSYTCIMGTGDIKIGQDCLIAPHSGIFANHHRFDDPTRPIREQGLTRKGILIEDDCWLGHKVTVLDGVTIGRGSVIGAGAVVTKDIPPYSVAIGVPAKVVSGRIGKAKSLHQVS
ncbi:transferase [filamentous cyanobacterium CCP1]|nr:transferase [filamentous cyanobacterium CCP2]PSB67489.1 transferase [filamentous cyanobacterium CCP1]